MDVVYVCEEGGGGVGPAVVLIVWYHLKFGMVTGGRDRETDIEGRGWWSVSSSPVLDRRRLRFVGINLCFGLLDTIS